jgi:tetratricopeptide (TPR) repeat protein
MKKICHFATLLLIYIVLALAFSGCQDSGLKQAQNLSDQGQLTKAIDQYRAILDQNCTVSERLKVNRFLNEVLQKVATKTVNEARSKLTDNETLQEYSQAIAILDSNKQYDNSQGDIKNLLSQFRKRQDDLTRRKELIISVGKLADQRKWSEAIKSINTALSIKNDSAAGDILQKLIKNRDSNYIHTVNAACKSGDWQQAQIIINEMVHEVPAPNNMILKPLISLVNKTRLKEVTDTVKDLRNNNRYFIAYKLLLDLDIDEPDFKELLKTVRNEGSLYYLNVGLKEYADQRPYHAYIAAVKAKTLNPDHDDIFKFHRDREDELDTSIRIQIGIPAFSSPKNKPEAGEEFSDGLISYLNKALPYGISIMERSKIDNLLKEQRFDDMKKAAEILGTDLFATGNVSTLNVNSQGREQTKRTITERVKMGKTTVPNPLYENYLAQYGRDKSDWPSRPSLTIDQDVYETIQYERGEGKVQGAMTVSVRMFTMGGAITRSETFRKDDSIEDSFQDGVPAANIKDDPLELPTILEMEQKLSHQVVENVGPWILESFQGRQGRYWLEGESHIKRREYDKAVVSLAKGYVYSIKDNVDTKDDWYKKIYQTVFFDLTESKN